MLNPTVYNMKVHMSKISPLPRDSPVTCNSIWSDYFWQAALKEGRKVRDIKLYLLTENIADIALQFKIISQIV